MQINDELIQKLADLSKLQLSQQEVERTKQDLQRMLDLVEQLNQVDVSGVEPLIYMTDEVNVLRKDEVIEMVDKQDALKNAPQRDSDYFKVPKVIKK